MNQFEIDPGRDDWADGQARQRLVRNHNPNQASVWDLTDTEMLDLYQTIHAHFVARIIGQPADEENTGTGAVVYSLIPERRRTAVGPCPCACNSGGFCGGCGHAGCGRR